MDGLVFDFKRLTARQMHNFLASVKDNNFADMADTFSKTVVSVPAEWGMTDMHSADEWMDLHYFNEFQPAITEFVKQGAERTKK